MWNQRVMFKAGDLAVMMVQSWLKSTWYEITLSSYITVCYLPMKNKHTDKIAFCKKNFRSQFRQHILERTSAKCGRFVEAAPDSPPTALKPLNAWRTAAIWNDFIRKEEKTIAVTRKWQNLKIANRGKTPVGMMVRQRLSIAWTLLVTRPLATSTTEVS